WWPGPGGRAAPVCHGQLAAGAPMRQEQFVARYQAEWQALERWLALRGDRPRHARRSPDPSALNDEDIP
ncbi:hypothetical protein K4H02_27950, partial [Mycobacterium tuberculosis]|nr:hypothetical protein [Mycobacterium tuberculosis]